MDDYEGLYNRVVPPLAVVQNQMEDYMKEHNQMKEIIRKYDETISTYALKHEIIEYSTELRTYQKAKPFLDF